MNRLHPFRPLKCILEVASGLLLASGLPISIQAAENTPTTDPHFPFRTDSSNADLPWCHPKPLEFPPHHSAHRISGTLVSADFIHRKGQLRATQTGELMEFTLPPYGSVHYLHAEADLRDVPLGTFCQFFLNVDADGAFTQLATLQDQFTVDMSHGWTYRLEEVQATKGRLLTTKHSPTQKQEDLGKQELLVSPETKVWIGTKPGSVQDLKPGDELLYNLSGNTLATPGVCTDLWVGTDTHSRVSEAQQKKFEAFLRDRGLPGWIEKTEGRTIAVTFFSGRSDLFKKTWAEIFVPSKEVRLCIANDELRTWNPPVDGERGTLTAVESVPPQGYGSSGLRAVFVVTNMLEGFRKGRVIRVFGPGWKVKDQPYGESLMGYGFGAMKNQDLLENPPKEYPAQFPFRTDFGNRNLPWYSLKDGVAPPRFSEHLVKGELLSLDPVTRTGQFRREPSGEVVTFTMREVPAPVTGTPKKAGDKPSTQTTPPAPAARYRGANAKLEALPLGQRYRFHLYQDAAGAFNQCTFISDEYTQLSDNGVTLRIESMDRNGGKINAAYQLALVKDYNGDMQRPADFARSEFRFTHQTRVWREQQAATLSDLKAGDTFLFHSTADAPGKPAVCTDLWILPEAMPAAADKENKAKR